MNVTWPRGSEWRKWDLHVHAPSTKLNDQFRFSAGDVLNEYCRFLNASDVSVFGITDYFSADVYFSVSDRFSTLYPASQKLLLCNIELRISETVNRTAEEVNTHLIFNTTIPNYKNQIKAFLQELKTNRTDPLGRNLRAAELTTRSQFESATTTRPLIREALEETFGRDADVLDFVLIVTAANNDGIRPQRGRKRKLLITDEIDKFSNAFFGTSRNVEYYSDTSRAEDLADSFDAKPVLSGSDAHSFDELRERLGQVVSSSNGIVLEPTWIKADPTYEGIKQIIYEPRNRVYIGEEPEILQRVRDNKTKYVENLSISSIDGYQGQHGTWFCEEEIVIGKELVAIIGNKGSGKSALTDILGLLGNSSHQSTEGQTEKLFSFLNKEKFLKRGCAANFVASLTWHDGSLEQAVLDRVVDRNLPERVEYLPQKYLERICTNVGAEEFRRTLNEIIFRYVEPAHRYGRRTLEELIDYRAGQVEEDMQDMRRDLHRTNIKVAALDRKLVEDYRQEIEEKLRQRKSEHSAHLSVRPSAVANPDNERTIGDEAAKIEKITLEIDKYAESIKSLKKEQDEIVRVVEELRQFKQSVERQCATMSDLEIQYQSVLESAGLLFDDVVRIKLDFSQVSRVLVEKNNRLTQIKTLLSDDGDGAGVLPESKDPLSNLDLVASESIVHKKTVLDQLKKQMIERQDRPAREYQAYLANLQTWEAREKALLGTDTNPQEDSVKGLENELRCIDEVYPEQRSQLKSIRMEIGSKIFRKKQQLTAIYNEIKESIDSEIERCRGELGDYSISIESGLEFDPAFYDAFLNFINQSRKGSYYGVEEGRTLLTDFCNNVHSWEDEAEVFSTLNEVVEALHVDVRSGFGRSEDTVRDIFKQMRDQTHPAVDLYDYVFGFEFLTPKYNLNADQKDLTELSPGERGGLLLIFYLMLDRRDVPLIIDQPEDNLDNKSVYEILVTFIKYAKGRRQIILVTHNPNLAVVADAEQVIHVAIDKKDAKNEFASFSGSIEAPKINQSVVDILEGTLPAFDNRRLKYRRHD